MKTSIAFPETKEAIIIKDYKTLIDLVWKDTISTTNAEEAIEIFKTAEDAGYIFTNNWKDRPSECEFYNRKKWIFHFNYPEHTFNLEGGH